MISDETLHCLAFYVCVVSNLNSFVMEEATSTALALCPGQDGGSSTCKRCGSVTPLQTATREDEEADGAGPGLVVSSAPKWAFAFASRHKTWTL